MMTSTQQLGMNHTKEECMVRRSPIVIGILLAGSIAGAKTPQALKAEMDALLPAGMKVRMAWCASNGSAYVYDSEENALRDLTPTSVFGSSRGIAKAFVSQDGEHVVLKDGNSDAIQKVKFDGTGKQTLFSQGTVVCTWKDPADNKQCFIASGLPSPYSTGTWVVGITDGSKRRQLTARVHPWLDSQYGNLGCGLSVDGKMIGGFYNGKPGLWPNPSGAFIPDGYTPLEPPGESQGCNFAMRPTTAPGVYEHGHFHENHREIAVHNGDGTYKEALYMYCNASAFVSGGEAHGLYWTNHVDYVTAQVESGPNPVLFDLKRQQCVALKDDCGGSCGFSGSNAILLPKVPAAVPMPSAAARISHSLRTPQKLYTSEGKLLPRSQIGASTSAIRIIRVSAGNQAAGIVVGYR